MKKGTLCILLGLLLILAAVGWTAYNFWDTARAGNAAGEVLEALLPEVKEPVPPVDSRTVAEAENPEEIEYPDYVLNPGMGMPVTEIDGVGYVGVLEIPDLELELPVCDECTNAQLKIAPCRYQGSAYLDDLVICAHNYNRHFGYLRNLSYGSEIIFTDMDGNRFEYEVAEIESLDEKAVEEMVSGDWDLTLFTCTLDGGRRITVRCIKK